jgi:hypothetical protein
MKKIALSTVAALGLLVFAGAAQATPPWTPPGQNNDDCGCATISQVAELDAPVFAGGATLNLFTKGSSLEVTAVGLAQGIDVKNVDLDDFHAKQDLTIDAPVTALGKTVNVFSKNSATSVTAIGGQQTFKGVNLD